MSLVIPQNEYHGTRMTSIMMISQAVAATATLLVIQGIPLSAEVADATWAGAIERLGLAIVLVVFFVWTGWEREKRMGKRIDQLEKQATAMATKLATLGALITETTQRDMSIIEEVMTTLKSRPCMAFDSIDSFEKWKRNCHPDE